MTISLAISHTPWVPERVERMRRLRASLNIVDDWTAGGPMDKVVKYQEFTERCPNWVWSEMQWNWSASVNADHHLFLQDDVIVAPRFWDILGAMLEAVPDQIVSLYNGHPACRTLARRGDRWCTTADGLVGMGYVFPHALMQEFVIWRETELRPRAVEHITEDTLIDVFSMATGRRIWHPLPSPIDHDVGAKSTYSNDNHMYRRPAVVWNDWDVCDWEPVDLYDPDEWTTMKPGPNGKQREVHLGRFYRGVHWLCKRWVKDWDDKKHAAAEADVCPKPYDRFFLYP